MSNREHFNVTMKAENYVSFFKDLVKLNNKDVQKLLESADHNYEYEGFRVIGWDDKELPYDYFMDNNPGDIFLNTLKNYGAIFQKQGEDLSYGITTERISNGTTEVEDNCDSIDILPNREASFYYNDEKSRVYDKDEVVKDAYNRAYSYYFCNVGSDNWPKDVDAFMSKREKFITDSGNTPSASDLAFEYSNGEVMEVYDKYSNLSLVDLYYHIDNYANNLISFAEKYNTINIPQKEPLKEVECYFAMELEDKELLFDVTRVFNKAGADIINKDFPELANVGYFKIKPIKDTDNHCEVSFLADCRPSDIERVTNAFKKYAADTICENFPEAIGCYGADIQEVTKVKQIDNPEQYLKDLLAESSTLLKNAGFSLPEIGKAIKSATQEQITKLGKENLANKGR